MGKMMRGKDEDVDKFIVQYETATSEMKSTNIEINEDIQAIHLLNSINVDESEKRNIVSTATSLKTNDLYTDVKQSIRLLKGSLVENKTEKKSEEAFFGQSGRSRSMFRHKNDSRRESSRRR